MKLYPSPVISDRMCIVLGEWGGYYIDVMPMLFNYRLVLSPLTDPEVYDFGWCFPQGPAATLAAIAWEPETEGEPVGFIKRVGSRVRQPGEAARSLPPP